MVPFAGWEMPVQYTGVIEEHRAVVEEQLKAMKEQRARSAN